MTVSSVVNSRGKKEHWSLTFLFTLSDLFQFGLTWWAFIPCEAILSLHLSKLMLLSLLYNGTSFAEPSWLAAPAVWGAYGFSLQVGLCPLLFDLLTSLDRSPNKFNLIPGLDATDIAVVPVFWCHLFHLFCVKFTYVLSCYWENKLTTFQLSSLNQLRDQICPTFCHESD